MRRIFRENGLSIVLFGMFFVIFLLGQSLTGYRENNHNREDHGLPAESYPAYLGSDHFLEATAENWESEFLQMFIFVVLTAFLYQKGSAESKDPDKKEAVDREPRRGRKDVPWPVRKGGLVLKVYENSLSLALLLLFLLSFVLHALGGKGEYNQDQLLHGGQQVSMIGYMETSRFWFESLQNWQSEFLAIGSMVVLTIWLRQKGSPESKPVDSPHSQTGND